MLPFVVLFFITATPGIGTAQTDAAMSDGNCMLQAQRKVVTAASASVLDDSAMPAKVPAGSPSGVSFLQWTVTTYPNKGMVIGCVSASLAVALAFALAGYALPSIPTAVVSILVISIYILLSVAIDLLIMYQKNAEGGAATTTYKFDPTCSVILTEAIKLVFSLILYSANQILRRSSVVPQGAVFADMWRFLLPAAFFTMNNIMVFVAIGGNDAAAFGVFRDTMILWTALIWGCMFKVPLGSVRLGGIGVIFFGLVVNRVGDMSGAKFSWAFLLVILMTVTNATGSVLNEYALKFNRELDINLQNVILYSMCIVFSVMILAVRSPSHLASAGAFFEGFTNWTVFLSCLQASAGLLVSRLLKYADAIYKTIGTCLRGPALVLVAPIVLGSPLHVSSIVSALIVASGCLTYLTQGALRPATTQGAEDKNVKESLRSLAPPPAAALK
jgi:hypothetical protein